MGVTLKQLAEMSGLSIRTVGRILSNAPNVAATKREKVLALARKHHYTPNTAARNLRKRSSRFVGIVGEDFRHDIFIRKLHSLESGLKSHGFYPLLGRIGINPSENGADANLIDTAVRDFTAMLAEWAGVTDCVIMLSSGPSGAMFGAAGRAAAAELERKLAEVVRSSDMHFIFVDRDGMAGIGDLLTIDRTYGIGEALNILAQSNRSNILRCGNLISRDAAWQKERLAHPDFTFAAISAEAEFDDGRRLGAEIVARRPDAVFFDTDRMAAGFLRYALEQGISIPRDLAVIGFDDDFASRTSLPTLSSIAQPVDELNDRILELLQSRHSGRELVHESFPTRFIGRESI